MLEKKKLNNWSNSYWNQIKKNIGLINVIDQEKLRKTNIIIFGVGGLGGPVVDNLVRSGCANITICDNGRFNESNLNRQLCCRDDIGKLKVDVIENLIKRVNPEIKVQKCYNVSEKNISGLLKNIEVVLLALDDPIVSIIISRECKEKNIPMLESWGIPYLWAWWFTSDSLNYETCYGLNTSKLSIPEIKKSNEILLNVRKSFLKKLLTFPDIKSTYNQEEGIFEKLISGELNSISLAPIVRLTSAYLAFEIIFSGILKKKRMILAPNIIGYDYMRMKQIKFN